MKFVGLSEETFLEHVINKHGNKVARRKPEKLRRECRICGKICSTDTELGEHISQHMHHTEAPFAGFGPRAQSESETDSEEEDRGLSSRGMRKRKSKTRMTAPPPPTTLRLTARSWEQKTATFIKKTVSKGGRKRDTSSEDEDRDLESSLELVRNKRRRLEESVKEKCQLCGAGEFAGQKMWSHLASQHRDNCF